MARGAQRPPPDGALDVPAALRASSVRGVELDGIKLVRAGAVPDEPVQWLIPGLVARGELADLSGDPGVGKGGICCSWAAQATRGNSGAASDEGVILLATEDRLGHIKARLRAEGADLDRTLLLDTREFSPVVFPGNVPQVEELVRTTRTALLVLDPALEFLDGALDSHRQQDVQRFTAALSGLAHRTGAAVLTVRHLNKASGLAAVYRGAGSIAFLARARMALLAAKDKTNGGRVLTVVKGNLGRDTPAVRFDLVERDGATVVAWGEPTAVSADELVTQDPRRRGPAPEKREAAEDLLADVLAGGPLRKTEVVERGRKAGVGRTTLYQAANAMGLVSLTLDLRPAWRLP